MKVYAKLKVIAVSEEQLKPIQKKMVPMRYVIANEGDSYLSLAVWGKEKINRCMELLESGTEAECIVSITGKVVEKDDGSKQYFNNFTILTIL